MYNSSYSFDLFTESAPSSFIETDGQEFTPVPPSPPPQPTTTTTAVITVPADAEQAASVEPKGKL